MLPPTRSNRRPFRATQRHPNVYIPPEILDQAGDDQELLEELLNPGSSTSSRLLQFDRLFRKFRTYYDIARSIPDRVRYVWSQFLKIVSSRAEFIAFVRRVWSAILRLPIVTFYRYLWHANRFHFFINLFVGYALPAILEALPWYFSRRKIGRELRDLRNKIHNRMVCTCHLNI